MGGTYLVHLRPDGVMKEPVEWVSGWVRGGEGDLNELHGAWGGEKKTGGMSLGGWVLLDIRRVEVIVHVAVQLGNSFSSSSSSSSSS